MTSSVFRFYVYAYVRENGTPYYIGKGTGRRINKPHSSMPLPSKDRRIILEDNLSEIGSFALERFYIRWWGRKDNSTGILRNKTDGGDGVSGLIPWNKDTKMSDSFRQRCRENMTGNQFSEATKAKLSQALKGRPKPPMTEATKLKLSVASKLQAQKRRDAKLRESAHPGD